MRPRNAALLFATAAAALCLFGAGGSARAAPNLNPFGAPSGLAPRLASPLRALEAPGAARVAQAQASEPARAQQPAPAPAAPGGACKVDEECPPGTICEGGTCRPFERAFNVLLFRKEGGFTGFIPFYFHQRGTPGYRIVVPFYWHFWGPQSKTRVFAPFYWRFEDHAQRRFVTVVGPYAHTVQPDAESWALWPIFYRSTKFGWAAPPLLSFKIQDPDAARSYGLYGLLYFWKRNQRAGTAFDLLFPFFVSKRSPGSAFTFALPLNFYWRSGEEKNLLLVPLLFQKRHAKGSTLVTPLGYQSVYESNRRGSVAWLYWFGRRKDSRYDVLFPLAWSFRGPTSNTTVVGLFGHLRRGSYSFSTLFPVYFRGRDHDQGSSWQVLLPIFFSKRGAADRTFTWLTPIGGYHRDREAKTRTLAMLLPPLLFRRDAQSELDVVALLYWRHRDVAAGATTRLIGNLYLRRDPQGASTVFFPLFWHFRDAATGATAHSLLPLYFRRSGPDETLTAAGVFPLWAYHRRFHAYGGRQGWSAGLTPLAFFGSRPERGHAVVFPLLWHFRGPRGTSTVVPPLFYRFADRRGADLGVPPLLYFQGHDGTSRYKIQFPLFWHFADDRRGRRTTVIPPVFFTRRRDGWSAGLFPLLFAGGGETKRHFVLFPLFFRFVDDERQRATTVFLNYMHRREGEQRTDALFPLLHYRRGSRPGGADERSFTLFPVVHYRRDAQRTVFASPLALWSRTAERKAGFVLPYFWWDGPAVSASGVPPLYFDVTRKEDGTRTRMVGPWLQTDGPRGFNRVLFPLFGRYGDAEETGTWVLPTFFRRRTREGYALDTVFPLFWWGRAPGYSALVVGPWFRRTTPVSHSTGLLPLYVSANNQERRLFVAPLVYHRRDHKAGTSRTLGVPLFYRSTSADGHRTVVFPLWWSGRREAKSHAVLFPLFWRFANAQERSTMNVLGPFIWATRGSYRVRGLVPIAWYSRDEEKGTASHALLPLFYESHGRAGLTVATLPFGFRRAPDRSWWYLGPIYHRDAVSSTFSMVLPLWFSHLNKATETRTRIVPPLLHFGRSRPDSSLSAWLALFWRHRDIDSATTLALPLFYDIHRFHQSRTTILLPLFARHRSVDTGNAYTLAPLLYRRSSPTDSTTVFFPLYWDWNGPTSRTTVLFPLFAHFRRPNWTAKFIFPNIYYRSGRGPAAGTSRLFVFPFWESATKRRGDYMWEVLLGLVGWERIGRNRFLRLFFIPFELEPAGAAQTAWYGKGPPRPRGTRATGVDTRVW